jgi:lipopolysaccharide export system protein LptA
MFLNLIRALAGLAALLVISAPAWAEKADASKPIEITADRGTLDQPRGLTVWHGNVIVNQGTLHATADEVTVTRDAQGRQTLQATGAPSTFRQRTDKGEVINGNAQRVDYTSADNTVVLTGNAHIQRGQDSVTGAKIVYNTQTEVYQVLGGGAAQGPNKGRVTVIIQPQNTAPAGNGKAGTP